MSKRLKHVTSFLDTISQGMYVCMYVCMYGWMDGWMNGWMDGWMDGRMYVYVCVIIL